MPALWQTSSLSPKVAFHIESDVKPLLADYLIAGGHTAFTPRTLRIWYSSDAARLLAAARSHRIVVTHNRKNSCPSMTHGIIGQTHGKAPKKRLPSSMLAS